MPGKNGFLTGKGLLSVSVFALMIAALLLVVGWNKVQPSSIDQHKPITFQECQSIHEGIIFEKDSIRVEKKIAFCNPIVENQKIPPHVAIDLGNGQLILPSEETATKAIFPVTFKYVADKDWHVIAKE